MSRVTRPTLGTLVRDERAGDAEGGEPEGGLAPGQLELVLEVLGARDTHLDTRVTISRYILYLLLTIASSAILRVLGLDLKNAKWLNADEPYI